MRTTSLLLAVLALSGCCIQMPTPRPEPIVDEDGGELGPALWPEGTLVFGTTDDNGELFQLTTGADNFTAALASAAAKCFLSTSSVGEGVHT